MACEDIVFNALIRTFEHLTFCCLPLIMPIFGPETLLSFSLYLWLPLFPCLNLFYFFLPFVAVRECA